MKKILFAALLMVPFVGAHAEDCKDGCSIGSPTPAPGPDPMNYSSLVRYSDGTIVVNLPTWYGYYLSGNEDTRMNGTAVCDHLLAKFVFVETMIQPEPGALVTFPAKLDGTPGEPRFINPNVLTSFIRRVICRAN